MRRFALVSALLIACVGCTSLAPPPREVEPPPFAFRLGPGDRVLVSVWGEKQLKQELELGPDGVVSLPLIGDVNMGGLTLDEARVDLAQRFKAGYVDPVISVTLLEMRSHVIHVLGEVRRPGTVPYVRGATVLGAIQAAGGFRRGTAHLEEVRIIRNRMARPEAYAIDLYDVLAGEIPDMWLIPGDSVFVPPRPLTLWSRWWRQALPWADGVEEDRRR